MGQAPFGTASPAATLNGTARIGVGPGGRDLDIVAAGDYLSYGTNAGMQLSTQSGVMLVEFTSVAQGTALYVTDLINGSGGFAIGLQSTGQIEISKHNIAAIVISSNSAVVGLNAIAWSYNSSTGRARIVVNGVVTAATSTQTLAHDTVALGRFRISDLAVSQPHKTYLFAQSPSEVFSDSALAKVTQSPGSVWQIFEDIEEESFYSDGGGAAALAGTATATATASGALSTQIPIIGAAATVATATGALSTSIPMLGAAVVTVTASGDLSAQIKFDGAAIAQALAAGGITTGIPLGGAAAGVASASGTLDASAALAAAAQAIATAVGSLTTQITLSGAAIAEALASGELTAPGSGLSGAAAGQVSAAGSLTTGIPLVGAAQAYATGVGGLTTIIPLAGASASVSAATGDLTVQTTLTGAAIAQALAGGVLTTQVVLSGAAVSLASAAGVLTGGSAIVDSTWLVRPKVRRYSVKPEQRIYKGSR